jgi:hypothetical protein
MQGGPQRQAKLAQVIGDHDLDPLVGDGGDEAVIGSSLVKIVT